MPPLPGSTRLGPVRYSVCVTHFNDIHSVRASLESLLGIIDERFEVIVVDNFSDDGSEGVLREYSVQGKISLIQERCSRGVGRNIAVQNARGEYIISGLDMDDTFRPTLGKLLDFYHKTCEGFLLRTEIATMVAPRALILDLGGWRDLQNNENWDLSKRAAEVGKFRWTIFPLLQDIDKHPERRRSFLSRFRFKYYMMRDDYRAGHRPFPPGAKVRARQRLLQAVVLITLPFYSSYKDGFKGFTIVDRRLFVDSTPWWTELRGTERMKRMYRARLGVELQPTAHG